MAPKILVSNDDGIDAPGLRAIVLALKEAGPCDVYVCAPNAERSAQSHAITIRHHLDCERRDVPGSIESWAVNGTPADSTRLALNSPLFSQVGRFDLIVSGINRGDNMGLHVTYSGTVGAAREAAIYGYPAFATSLDDYSAHTIDAFAPAASIIARLALAAVTPREGGMAAPADHLRGLVVNLNVPGMPHGAAAAAAAGDNHVAIKGIYLARQGASCFLGKFAEVEAHHHNGHGPAHSESDKSDRAPPTGQTKSFKTQWGAVVDDGLDRGDRWAVQRGFVAATVLGMTQDVTPSPAMAAALGAAIPAAPHARAWDAGLAAARALIQQVSDGLGLQSGSYLEAEAAVQVA